MADTNQKYRTVVGRCAIPIIMHENDVQLDTARLFNIFEKSKLCQLGIFAGGLGRDLMLQFWQNGCNHGKNDGLTANFAPHIMMRM